MIISLYLKGRYYIELEFKEPFFENVQLERVKMVLGYVIEYFINNNFAFYSVSVHI